MPVILAASAVQAETIYVDVGNCPGPGDGSPLDPYCSIQTAIDNAEDTDEIVVAPGTYVETINFLGKAVWLHSSDEQDVTVIDSPCCGSAVVCTSGEGPDTVLSGFVITGGVATLGGGMFNDNSSPTVHDCIFIGNLAGALGGGMCNANSSNPSVTNCTFSGNWASDWGGGMYNSDSSPTVIDCTFNGNSATGAGAMDNVLSSPRVVSCTFKGNTASSVGGGMYNYYSSPTVIDCTFSGSSAANGGGGMYNTFSNSTVIDCTFNGNLASSGGGMRNYQSSLTVANCILWGDVPDEVVDDGGAVSTVTYSAIQGGWPGVGNIDADPMFVDPDNGDLRLSPGSPCIDAGDNTAVPEDIDTDLDGNPRFLEIPETPDTGFGDPPIVDMGAYESLGGGCLAITSIETVCHGDGSTFTVNVEGLNACTGGTTMATFTGSGGAVGDDLCATLLINTEQGGFCCSTHVCATVPDCSGVVMACDLDGDGLVGVGDFLALLSAWGPNPGHPADFDGDGQVGVADFLILLANWGP